MNERQRANAALREAAENKLHKRGRAYARALALSSTVCGTVTERRESWVAGYKAAMRDAKRGQLSTIIPWSAK